MCKVVLEDLLRAREGFVLSSDLHLVYLVTPINVEVEPDWKLYYERFMELPALDQARLFYLTLNFVLMHACLFVFALFQIILHAC
jgi:hypothetical protein